MTPVSAVVGFGSLGVGVYDTPDDGRHNGRPIRSHGITYTHGLMAHAPSQIHYSLSGRFRLLNTQILTQEDVDCGDGVVFRVFLDGQEVYSSSPVYPSTPPETIQLDVAGANAMELVVDTRQTSDCDWAIWGDPTLISPEQVAQNYPTPTFRPSPTPNPNMPCGQQAPEALFVFLACDDVRRIRSEILNNPATAAEWHILRAGVDEFLADLPRAYSPSDDAAWMWLDFMPRNIALAYLVSGDPRYARALSELLGVVVDGTPPAAPEVGQPQSGLTIPPGVFTSSYISLLFAYITVREAPLFDEEARSVHDAYFMEQARRLEAWSAWVASYPNDIWNQFVQADAAIATIALTFPDDPRSPSLYARAQRRMQDRIANWYDADGGWREYADNYSPLVLQSLLLYAETEFHAGRNVYGLDSGGRSLHTLCQWYLQVMTPDGVLPAMGDGHWLQSLDPGLLRLCAMRTADPTLTFAFDRYSYGWDHFPSRDYRLTYLFDTIAWSDAATPAREPDWSSVLLPDSGLAVLRSGWSPDSQYVLLEFAEDGLDHPLHQHQSFGNIVLYDGGAWILENGYRGRTEEEYWRAVSTADHSTLTLDDTTQTNMRARRTFFASPGTVAMVSATSQTYPSLTHTRTVLWSESWHQWVVVDDAALSPPSGGHTLQLRWYVSLPDARHRLRDDHTEEPEAANWSFTRTWGTRGTLAIDMLPGAPASFSPISRIYLDAWEGRATGVEMEVSPSSWPARLVSVLTSNLAEGVPVSSILRTDTEGATLVSSQRAEAHYDWILPRVSSSPAQVGSYTVTGHAACRESNGDMTAGYCLLGGTWLELDQTPLVSAPAPISIQVDLFHSLIYVDAPYASTVALFWPSDVAAVEDELGTPSTFSVSGSILSLQVAQGTHAYTVRGPSQ
jgi:hypothetical protein